MPKRFTYHRPEKLDEAQKLLARDGTQPILIHPRMNVEPYAAADAMVDLSRLNLNYIKQEGDVIRLGVMTTLQDIADSLLLRTLANGILSEAASLTAHLGLRNVSTIGGVMMNPQSAVDVMLALLCLGVSVETRHVSPRSEAERDGASLQEVSFSCSPQARGILERVARTPRDVSIVAACALKDKNVTRVAVGGVGIVPTLVDPLKLPDSISPIVDFRGSAEYQREMVGVLVKRTLQRISIR